jgi:glycosyltransferase involved in cell wall biosynthesis
MRKTGAMKNNIVKNLDRPRILMIAPVFYPYPPVWPEGMVNAKLALAMKTAGWHIDIIVAGYPHASNRYPSDEAGWKELVNNVHIINREDSRTLTHKLLDMMQGFILTGHLLRQLGWGFSVIEVANKLNLQHNYDVIISRAVPDYAHFAALLVHRKTGIPWIANWNDPTPNHKFPPPYGEGPFSPLAPDIEKWYRAICKYCFWHTFPSERMQKYMCSYLPGQIKTKSSVMPHIAMEKFSIPPVPHHGFSICYAGSVLPPREVTVLLEGLKRFREILGNENSFYIRFLVDKPEIVAESAKTSGVEDIIKIEATVPYSQMPKALAKSDVLVIIEAPLKEGIFMPSKIVDYVQIGRPILALAPVMGTINDLFSKYGGGIAVDCKSPDAVTQALQTLYGHWKEGTLSRTYSSTSLMRLFSEKNVLRRYMDLFKRIPVKPASGSA